MTTINCSAQTRNICLGESPMDKNEVLERKKKRIKENETLALKENCVYKRSNQTLL